MGDVPTGDAGDPDDLAGAVVEPVEPHQQHVGQLGGHLPAGGPRRADQLLDEEGVALGPVDDLGDARLADRGVLVDQVDEEAHVGVAERLDLHALDPAQPGPLGDLRPQRVPAVEVVGAVGHDQPHRAGEGPGEQEAQHVARGLVGPVGVLDDHEQGALLRHGLEQVVHRGEDVAPVERLVLVAVVGGAQPSARLEAGERGVTVGHARGHLRPLREDAPEDLGEGEVGERPVGQVEAVSGEHQPALTERDVAQLGQQSRLADARVAREEHGVRSGTGPGRANAEPGGQVLQLGIASDEVGAAGSGHVGHCGVPHRQRGGAFRCRGHRVVRGYGGRRGARTCPSPCGASPRGS